jgi:hypothetical protein
MYFQHARVIWCHAFPLVLVLVIIVAVVWLTPTRVPCTSRVTGPQALPWLADNRDSDSAGCAVPADEVRP